MAEYIDRQAAIEALNKLARSNFTLKPDYESYLGALHDAGQDIKYLPSADVEPVRHGRWIRVTKDGIDPQVYCCDVCGRLIKYEDMPALLPIRYPYCHCGARMDGGQE